MKKKQKTKKVKPTPNVKLIQYTIGATIPTGAYANLRPEITVKADSLQSAEKFVMPYIEKLFATYREPQFQAPSAFIPVNTISTTTAGGPSLATDNVEMPPPNKPTTPNMTQPFKRANQAIASCMTIEALGLIKNQIIKSTKLTESEKAELQMPLANKLTELNKSNETISSK